MPEGRIGVPSTRYSSRARTWWLGGSVPSARTTRHQGTGPPYVAITRADQPRAAAAHGADGVGDRAVRRHPAAAGSARPATSTASTYSSWSSQAPGSRAATGQYDGWLGSIWLTQATTPPPTCTASAKPAPLTHRQRLGRADAGLAVQHDLLASCGSCAERVAVEELALGDQHRAGDLVDLVLVGLAHVDQHEVALAARPAP